MDYTTVTFDLKGSSLAVEKIQDCLRLMQTYLLSPGYMHQLLFIGPTLDAVREAIGIAGVFHVAPKFDWWTTVCGESVGDFVARYTSLYNAFLLERRKACKTHYADVNEASRLARVQQGTSASVKDGTVVSDSGKGAWSTSCVR